MHRHFQIALVAVLAGLSGTGTVLADETVAPINQGGAAVQNPLDEPSGSGSSSAAQTGSTQNGTGDEEPQARVRENANGPRSGAGAIEASVSQPSSKPGLTPGPLLERRREILNFLNKAKQAGIGVAPYENALASIESEVKAGKSEADIKPRVNSLIVALSKQVENLKSIKAAAASKASAAQGGPFPAMGTPESNSGFGFENGVFKIKPARPLATTVSGLFAGLNPKYQQYASVGGRGIPESMMEQLLFDLTNKHRRENGMHPYAWSPKLAGLARAHARDMVSKNFFAHVNPRHQGPVERAAAAGYQVGVKENIGMAGAGRGTPLGMIILVDDGLMKSPGHRAAILDPKGRGAGMGVCYDVKNGGIKVCQVFSPNDF